MKILIVDDHAYNRDLLNFILEDEGHSCVEAENGKAACEMFKNDSGIELILMDINMPEMDGIAATKIIKQDEERFVPVIFVTALDDADMVAQCLDAGGDDFVPKPVNENVLLAKIKAHARSQSLYSNLKSAHQSLQYHNQLVSREHSIVEHIFARCNQRSKTICENISTYTSPMSMFDGDMVLSAASPSGGLYLIVGDFTGHGLAAAMGSLPVAEVFFTLVSHQAGISQIATELNTRLYELLPANMFCCAFIAHIDYTGEKMTLWSGGMNDFLRVKVGSTNLERVQSMHMPLGILESEEFDDSPQIITVDPGEKIYIYTDGVNEASNKDGEEFGLERLEALVLKGGEDVVVKVTQAVNEFHEGCEQSDDISIVEYTGGPLVHKDRDSNEIVDVGAKHHGAKSFPWRLSMRLEGEDLRDTSIVNQILAFVASIQGIELHQDKIFTIVSELYSNSLEHGVLQLSSDLKSSADGFEEYYRQRQQRLDGLTDEFIELDFIYLRGEPNKVKLVITDCGEGFDVEEREAISSESEHSHGRGLSLLKDLCSELTYSNGGRTATAVYELCRHG
ncbi:Response regulators consisting of a CheY-like receiver domain and a winged-helix DNA-binding domain [Alteromonadaceae bacterium Bs31]|nr:Response regulators consisting of a CheY-like receiver domain and a winged-helix DNA-binding domain [Alteromonadaceae bacterium Bs31]